MEFLEEAHKVTFVYLINLTLRIEAVLIFQLQEEAEQRISKDIKCLWAPRARCFLKLNSTGISNDPNCQSENGRKW